MFVLGLSYIAMTLSCKLTLLLGVFALGGAIALWLWQPAALRWKILFAICLALCAETLILRNPYFLQAALNRFHVRDMGFRQYVALECELMRMQELEPVDYLAVGSSQVGRLYEVWAGKHDDFDMLSMGGMCPYDYLLHRDIIDKKCDKAIILTLSDFDLANWTNMLGAKLAPPQPAGKLLHYAAWPLKDSTVDKNLIWEFLIANKIAAYRLQYIFKGLADKKFKRMDAYRADDITAVDQDVVDQAELEALRYINSHWFATNIEILDEFFAWAAERNLRIFVIEGGYYPDVLREQQEIHDEAMDLLAALCDRHNNAILIGAEKLYPLTNDDYHDYWHVESESGLPFSESVMQAIQNY
ncbi:hypothetical protein JXA32_03725 [Candidatus Sumerlaeota bacterium]|nr:hypothetical protein [Candidatus Sumerlaeota bacterium]